MKKIMLTVAVVIMLAACIVVFSACNTAEPLQTPTKIAVSDEGILTWNAVENASSYLVKIDDDEYKADTNNLDIFMITDQYKTYEITVMAIGDDVDYNQSDVSQTFNYVLEISPTAFEFTYLPDGSGYEFRLNRDEIDQITGKIIVPDHAPDGKPVAKIGIYGFNNFRGITSVLMPDTISELGKEDFAGCLNLKRVHLSDNITEIPRSEFMYCVNLVNVNIPKFATKIGGAPFEECRSLESIYIPEFVSNIEATIFWSFDSLVEIEVDKNNETYMAEGNCLIERETGTLVAGCATSVIPDCVKEIGSYAFYYCTGLTEITIPSSVEIVGGNAFKYCSNLTSVKFEEGLKLIGGETILGAAPVFVGCNKLTEIVLPASVEHIAGSTFALCENLTSVSVAENGTTYRSENNVIIRNSDNFVALGLSGTTVPTCAKGISPYAFYSTDLGDIVIPEGVTTIENYAFSESSIKSVKLPNTLKTIEQAAFCKCKNLVSVAIPASVEKIGASAFGDNAFLSVTLPSTVKTIETGAFNSNSTVYTDAPDRLEGWVYKQYATGWVESWITPFTMVFYNCTLDYCDGIPCVVSFTFIGSLSQQGDDDSVPFYFLASAIPAREGYTFKGWAVEENGEVVYEPIYVDVDTNDSEDLVDGVPHYNGFQSYYDDFQPIGTEIYAVWEKQ